MSDVSYRIDQRYMLYRSRRYDLQGRRDIMLLRSLIYPSCPSRIIVSFCRTRRIGPGVRSSDRCTSPDRYFVSTEGLLDGGAHVRRAHDIPLRRRRRDAETTRNLAICTSAAAETSRAERGRDETCREKISVSH